MMQPHERLDERIQRWIFRQGWPDLRQLQKDAMEPVLSKACDVLISASTASGKTEAFFLPALSASAGHSQGFCILYLSPLKALINDQHRRLESLGDALSMPITPWHGDSVRSRKEAMKKSPSGVLLTTPESLESMLINHGAWAKKAFCNLNHIVIDEFHAFIGTERGQQLLSLLHRIEHLTGRLTRPIPRVGLSATLGNIESVPPQLRPNRSLPCQIITGSQAGNSLQLQLIGYVDPINPAKVKEQDVAWDIHRQQADFDEDDEADDEDEDENEDEDPVAEQSLYRHQNMDEQGQHQKKRYVKKNAEYHICQDLYDMTRGGANLIFTNSRARTEGISNRLSELCQQNLVPNEYFPHHGSLAKEERQFVEGRLQQSRLPTTAVCTQTLELGIDIGNIDAVYQVHPPHSVSSLRQRMGRSGRRDGNSILRVMIPEMEIFEQSPLPSRLRLGLVQSIAMLHLLIKSKWYEPADQHKLHLSTLLHQCLAVIAQYKSIRADELYKLLCQQGPFQRVSPELFMEVLRDMGKGELITQLRSGELTVGIKGESMIDDFHFYAAFNAPEEYRVVHKSRFIGMLPVEVPLMAGQRLILSGRKWRIKSIDQDKKEIVVAKTRSGVAPIFQGCDMMLEGRIRQTMREIYERGEHGIQIGNKTINFLSPIAEQLFAEGIATFRDYRLKQESLLVLGADSYLFTWASDRIVHTLTIYLNAMGMSADGYAGVIEISGVGREQIQDALRQIAENGLPRPEVLAANIPNKEIEKFDGFLSTAVQDQGYASMKFDCPGALSWVREYVAGLEQKTSDDLLKQNLD